MFKVDAQGVGVVKNAWRDAPEKRLALVEALREVEPTSPGDRGYDPAVHALLAREAANLKRVIAGAVGSGDLKNPFKGLSRTLYPYQREGVKRFLRTTRLLLADDMGLGKTAQAIACCSVLWRAGRVKRGLIIAPASLKPQWAREWAQFSDMLVQVVDGTPDDRRRIYDNCPEGFLIINYEQLLRDLDDRSSLGARPGGARRGAADQELGDQDGALGEGPESGLPPGSDRDADGEPGRGAGVGRRVGRRHGA